MEFETSFIEIDESKNIFEEIMGNFYHKNYRSCIVSLNSLIYYDLMKKIEILKNNYDDKKSKDIYNEISNMIDRNDKYSDIEIKLLNLCKDKNLINNYFYEKAESLRKLRNHCAHPAFYIDKLYIPQKIEVLMYIDCIYNELLRINAINYYNAVNFVLDDIKEAYDSNIKSNSKGLKTRACRLYSKFDTKNRQNIFNSLFELSIIKNDDDCRKYRDYTYNYMLWLVEFLKSKNIVLDLGIIKKFKISHLDRDFFDGNPYISKIIINNIITLKDVEENNYEIFELYKQFLYENKNLYEMYDKLFLSFSEFVDFLVDECDNWIVIYNAIINLEEVKTKQYFYKLLKKLIALTPELNGFDKSDICINLFTENRKLLFQNELDELFGMMIDNNQFFNSLKNKNTENKNSITAIFGIEFDKKRKEILELRLPEDYEPSFLE